MQGNSFIILMSERNHVTQLILNKFNCHRARAKIPWRPRRITADNALERMNVAGWLASNVCHTSHRYPTTIFDFLSRVIHLIIVDDHRSSPWPKQRPKYRYYKA
jgi:hypothetical protein